MNNNSKKYNYLISDSAIVRFTDQGEGTPLVLLHGYLETLDIWQDFARELAKHYRVICIDHMGHGETRADVKVFTLEFSAGLIYSVLEYLKIDKAIIIGHSMGGYAMLALEDLYPNKVIAMVMFHAVPWADSEDKKINREREMEMIKTGKRSALHNIHIPFSFADDNIEKFAKSITFAKQLASQCNAENLIGALKGMKARKDRTHILEKTSKPVLFFVGKKDNYIPEEKILKIAEKVKIKTIVFLQNSGHMGFIEEQEKATQEVSKFIITSVN